MRRLLVLTALLAACTGGEDPDRSDCLRLDPAVLSLGPMDVGSQPADSATAALVDDCRRELVIEVDLPQEPFSLEMSTSVLPAQGEIELLVGFDPQEDALAEALVPIQAEGVDPISLELTGRAGRLDWPWSGGTAPPRRPSPLAAPTRGTRRCATRAASI